MPIRLKTYLVLMLVLLVLIPLTGRAATHNDNSDGHAGFSYTKLDANGNSLPAAAATWSCVRDNVTSFNYYNGAI